MTYQQVYLHGKERLAQAGTESPAFETMCLFEEVFGLNRQTLAVHGQENAPNREIVEFNEMIRQRCDGQPLQYIIGHWPFLDLDLLMGEGVLIAREDTEVLVRTAAEKLSMKDTLHILDLCAGTGAVGLGTASLLKKAQVQCVEWYPVPCSYLEKNIERSGLGERVRAVRADVREKPDPGLFQEVDAILTNPPYIESGDLPSLQQEVQREPDEALDGGSDGLQFYRLIAENWLQLLRTGGLFAAEIGEGQAQDVTEILASAGIRDIGYRQDFNGITRVVFGTMSAK